MHQPHARKDSPGRSLHRADVIYNRNPVIEKMVFICGLHRSGTSLLEQYLYAHYDVSVLRANVPENEGQHLQLVYPQANLFGGAPRFAFASQMRPDPPDEASATTYRRQILAQWKPFVVGTARTLLEKSPPNLTKMPWLRRVFPGAQFIVLVRDPRAVAAANQKRHRALPLEMVMMHWSVAHSIALRDLADDCRILKYEDFCADPPGALTAAGIDTILTQRVSAGDIDERFRNIVNKNDAYIARHTCSFYGEGAWRHFGYDI